MSAERRCVGTTECACVGGEELCDMRARGLPSPIYDDGAVTLYHGDCLEILPLLDAGAAAVCVMDPPYNCGVRYGGPGEDASVDDRRPWDAWSRWFDLVLSETTRIAPDATLAFLSQTAHKKYIRHGAYEPDWTCVWHKPLALAVCGAAFMPHWEAIDFWGLATKRTHDLGPDVLSHNVAPRGDIDHPTPKPLPLMRALVRQVTNPDDVVLDPFAGSGTTLLAARMEGRRAIGIERSAHYCRGIAERLRWLPEEPRRGTLSLFGQSR